MGNPVRRFYTLAGTAVGPQVPLNLDWLPVAQTTIAVWVAATAAYSVEGTLDDLNDADQAATARWFTLDQFPVGTVISKYAALINPWLFLRINITALTGDVELRVQQAWNSGPRG
jgi:hypothetical protein